MKVYFDSCVWIDYLWGFFKQQQKYQKSFGGEDENRTRNSGCQIKNSRPLASPRAKARVIVTN